MSDLILETRPCPQFSYFHPGLPVAIMPDFRGLHGPEREPGALL